MKRDDHRNYIYRTQAQQDQLILELKLKNQPVNNLFIYLDPKTGFNYGWSSLVFNFNLLVVQATDWIVKKFSGKTLDQHIEDKTYKETQKMFVQYGFKPVD